MKYLKTMTCAVALCATSGFAAGVDFENEFPLSGNVNKTDVGLAYSYGGINFSSTENMQLVKTGGHANGFVPNDTPNAANPFPVDFGNVFLTGDFMGNTNMNLSFSTLKEITFQIADIDGAENTNQHETFTFSAFLNGLAAGAPIVISTSDTTVDAEVVQVSFSGLFDEIRITGTTPGESRKIGWGIDNIETIGVPVPAAGLLLLSALGGVGLMGRRKKRAN